MSDYIPYYLTLLEIPQIGSETMRKLIGKFVTPENILIRAKQKDFGDINRLPKNIFEKIKSARKRLDFNRFIVKCLDEKGVKIILETDKEYPEVFKLLKSPPFIIFAWGNLTNDIRRSIAIIGSRTPSKKGSEIAYKIAFELSKRDYKIVSGYADGIDISAHLGAIKAKGQTILILPFGILNFKLKGGIKSVNDIVKNGAIISEVHPKAPWQVGYAHNRNRLIVALSEKVLLVETRLQSGSMNTFNIAQKLNRKIFTIQYKKYPLSAKGNKSLISKGAIPISSYKDIDIVTNL